MFTGIIEELGTVRKLEMQGESGRIYILAKQVLEHTQIGESIAVNGVCLTVTNLYPDGFAADVMAETLRRSNLGQCNPNDLVNLERAMAVEGRFGGHIVSGHIDGTGQIKEYKKEGNAVWITIVAKKSIMDLIVEKGSVCVDGISLTVAEEGEDFFKISMIPHTGEVTTLLRKQPGDFVNLENDIVGKYVQKFLNIKRKENDNQKSSNITMKFLEQYGI